MRLFHSEDHMVHEGWWRKSGNVLDYEAIENTPGHDPTLTEIMHLVDMPPGITSAGWNDETARLFAIDTAMTSIRRHLAFLSETDKHSLVTRLHEARSLVVAGRDSELGFIQGKNDDDHLRFLATVAAAVIFEAFTGTPFEG